MDLRITEAKAGPLTIISIQGELSGDGVAELERICRQAGEPLQLELSEMRRTDKCGRRLLRRLAIEGVQLSGLSPYMKLLLEQ